MLNRLPAALIMLSQLIANHIPSNNDVIFNIAYQPATNAYRFHARNPSNKDVQVQIQAYALVGKRWIIIDDDLDHLPPVTSTIGECGLVIPKFRSLSKNYELDPVARYITTRADKKITRTKVRFEVVDCRDPTKVYYESNKLDFLIRKS